MGEADDAKLVRCSDSIPSWKMTSGRRLFPGDPSQAAVLALITLGTVEGDDETDSCSCTEALGCRQSLQNRRRRLDCNLNCLSYHGSGLPCRWQLVGRIIMVPRLRRFARYSIIL